MSTHAHYPGEFGARQQTSTLAKDPAYRAARAEHFAREAQRAGEAHRTAESHVDRAMHATVVAHAAQMARKHARAAEKMAPGTEHARYAKEAHAEASRQHENVTMRSADGGQKQTQKIENKTMRDVAVQPRMKSASLAPEEKVRVERIHEQMRIAVSTSPEPHSARFVDPSKQMTQPIPVQRSNLSSQSEDHRLESLTQKHSQVLSTAHGEDLDRILSGITARRGQSDAQFRQRAIDNTHPDDMNEHLSSKQRAISDEHLSRLVREAANAAPVEHGIGDRKVFIHRVHEAIETHVPGVTLHELKERLKPMVHAGQVKVSRADFVGAMNIHDVRKSETLLGGATAHFVQREPGHEVSREKLEEHEKVKESMGHQHWRETEFK